MKKDIFISLVLIVVIVMSRTLLNLGDNFELVTAGIVFSTFTIKNNYLKFITPTAALIVSDVIIGNSNILLFTWSGFAFVGLFSYIFQRFGKEEKKFLNFMAPGLLGVLVFFLWTNFGVVLLSDAYSNDLSGLMRSYINALPFLRNQLLSNALFLPLFYGFSQFLRNEFLMAKFELFLDKAIVN